MLKRREKDLKMEAIAAQSTAGYDLVQQSSFLYASILNTSKNAYDLFASKMLQWSNAVINSKNSRRRRTSIQQMVCGDDNDNRCVCDYKTPCNRQNILKSKCMQNRKLKQISSSEQTPAISLQHRPNIDGVAATFETALEVELVATPAITVNDSVVEIPTVTLRSDASACICADEVRRTTAKNEFASTLFSKEALFHATIIANSRDTIIPSTIKIGKPITITTTLKTGLLSLIRNVFLMVAILLTVLTLQRVSGQYLLSIAATTAAATATTTSTEATSTISTKSINRMAIASTRDIGTTTINPMISTTVKNMINITETNNFNDRQASNKSKPPKTELKTQQSGQKPSKSYYNELTLLPPIYLSLKDFDTQADGPSQNLWENYVGIVSNADVITKHKFTSESNASEGMYIHQMNNDSRRKMQRNKSVTYTPAHTGSRSLVQKSNHRSVFSHVSASTAKLQNANKRNKISQLIYNKSKFFNEEQSQERQQKITALQQRRRSKRSTVESIVTQPKSNNTELVINSNRSSKNNPTFKSEISGNLAGVFGTYMASNITTNKYSIKNPYTIEDSNEKEHSANDQKLLKLVMDGLGLEQLPNMKKVNISQREYVTKYREYLRRVHDRKRRELAESTYAIGNTAEWELESVPLRIVSIAPNVTKYETYLRRKRNIQHFLDNFHQTKDGVTDVETVTNHFVLPRKQRNNDRMFRQKQTTMILHFALETNAAQLQPGDVEEANIRLMLIYSSALAVKPNKKKQKFKNRSCGNSVEKSGKRLANSTVANDKQKHVLNLKVYQRLGNGKRVCLDSSKLNVEIDQSRRDDTHSQWLQFDVTKAVETWLREQHSNLGLEVQCDNCQRVGARILNDISSPTNVDDMDAAGTQLMPILNIIGRLGVSYKEIRTNKHSNSAEEAHHHHNVATFSNGRQRPNGAIANHSCHKGSQRCCRHTMEVIFKEIKGFEFIIQPKVFDAGYCHGRCPPRYNPAHHHAMLQSLIWKQNRERAPRPCCAPSKLVELEVLHVDEKDSEKLRISTWTDMRVVECACS